MEKQKFGPMATKSTEISDDKIEEICSATAKMEFSKVRVEMPERIRNANFAEGMIKPAPIDSDNDDDEVVKTADGKCIGEVLFKLIFYAAISCLDI